MAPLLDKHVFGSWKVRFFVSSNRSSNLFISVTHWMKAGGISLTLVEYFSRHSPPLCNLRVSKSLTLQAAALWSVWLPLHIPDHNAPFYIIPAVPCYQSAKLSYLYPSWSFIFEGNILWNMYFHFLAGRNLRSGLHNVSFQPRYRHVRVCNSQVRQSCPFYTLSHKCLYSIG